MTLSFNSFDVAAVLTSFIYISLMVSNGISNWQVACSSSTDWIPLTGIRFEGAALLAMFIIIAISAYSMDSGFMHKYTNLEIEFWMRSSI